MDAARQRVRDQALEVARGWSGPGTPPSWQLTAVLFDVLARDDVLLALAAEIPAERLPALLFVASVQYAAARHPTEPFASYFPSPGADRQPPLDDRFAERYRAFARAHRDELAAVWRARVYQMNEVARAGQIALGLMCLADLAPGRSVTMIDVGTAAGFGLFLDRYRYELSDGRGVGPPTSAVRIPCDLEGALTPSLRELPIIERRVGVDVAPIDLADADARAWMAACVPPEHGAMTRAQGAIDLVRSEAPAIVPGSAATVLPDLLGRSSDHELVCVTDAYTAVFFDEADRTAVRDLLASHGRDRDVAWISLDPLVPLGTDARRTAQGDDAPTQLVERNRRGGVFGALTITAYLGGRRTRRVLAAAHPSGTRLEWLDPVTASST